MPKYANGHIPLSELVHLGTEHWLTPATAMRWVNLVADVRASEGVTLRITGGPNGYRNMAWQRVYWDALPYPQAAYPGTSSHGGTYRGRDSMAIDVDNWSVLGKSKFYSYARKHGFDVDVFSWEPWHIVDWSPWSLPPGGSGGSSSVPQTLVRNETKGNNVIRFLYADNGGPQWTVINYSNGSAFRAYNQSDGNDLSRSLGFSAEIVSSQVLANAIALAEGLSGHAIRYIN